MASTDDGPFNGEEGVWRRLARKLQSLAEFVVHKNYPSHVRRGQVTGAVVCFSNQFNVELLVEKQHRSVVW